MTTRTKSLSEMTYDELVNELVSLRLGNHLPSQVFFAQLDRRTEIKTELHRRKPMKWHATGDGGGHWVSA